MFVSIRSGFDSIRPGSMFITVLWILATCASAAPKDVEKEKRDESRGLISTEGEASPGYTLISPFSSHHTFLLDPRGRVVHQWESGYEPGLAPYLLPNGNLLRGIQIELDSKFGAGGIAGGVQEFSWDGTLLWEFHLSDERFYHHHDIEPLPNGNFLMVAWESKTKEEVLAVGRRPSHAGDKGLWPEVILEIEPIRPIGARVVWEWKVWDHLIQDTDPDLPNYGVIADHPEKVDINGDIVRESKNKSMSEKKEAPTSRISAAERARLIALGYLSEDDEEADPDEDHDGGDGKKDLDPDDPAAKRERERSDWLHINGVDYNPELDQIVVSSWFMNEIWIIDHSTTREEAAGSTGGRAGKGGDLLYRWGNPQTYNHGTEEDRKLFHQHDPQWIPPGYPGEGNLTIFNNGRKRPEKEYSTVLEIALPLQENGTYAISKGKPYGPEAPAWKYDPPEEDRFFASFISGTHRLENGNTMICSGPDGRAFEVSPAGKIVWEYRNPFAQAPETGKLSDENYAMFRATRISLSHPGIRDKELTPLDPQPKTAVELVAEKKKEGTPSGWKELLTPEAWFGSWRDGSVAKSKTFRGNPDGDGGPVLECSGEPHGSIRFDSIAENFLFEFQWKPKKESSKPGILVWSEAFPAIGEAFPKGFEIVLTPLKEGEEGPSGGELVPLLGATMTPDPRFASSETHEPPDDSKAKTESKAKIRINSWNRGRIIAIDGAISLELNGVPVDGATGCVPARGYLGLKTEGGEVDFRRLRLWPLPKGTHAADASRSVREVGPSSLLFNGLDIESWKVLEGDWNADGGVLHCSSGPGRLEVPLPDDETRFSFDVRSRGETRGESLPLEIGDRSVSFSGRARGWSRIRCEFGDDEVQVEWNGKRQTLSIDGGARPKIVLTSAGGDVEFRNLFGEK